MNPPSKPLLILSAGARAEADTRYWESLPLFISFAAVELPAGDVTATVEFIGKENNVLTEFTRTFQLTVSPDREIVVYVSDKSIITQSL